MNEQDVLKEDCMLQAGKSKDDGRTKNYLKHLSCLKTVFGIYKVNYCYIFSEKKIIEKP